MSSKYLCLSLNCGTRTCDSAIQHHNATCYDSFGSPIPTFRTNYTDEEIAGLKRIGKGDAFGSDKPLAEEVIPSYDRFNTWFKTLDAVEYAHRLHHLYGIGVMVFWVAVVFVGIGNKAYLAVSQMHRSHQSFDISGIWTETGSWFRRNVTIPATFGYRCAQNVWWATIPSRIQTLTIAAFLLMNVVFCVHGYRIIDDNIYFGTPIRQVLRYAADRTGIISFANFPFIWLFGMRNNVAIWLTGWDFGTYNNFHRWCARISTLEAVAHSIFYTILIFMNGGWNYYVWWFTMWFWNAGQIATVSMCALLVFSIYWIRRRFYEAFLLIHIGLSILILLTMLGHVSIFDGEYDVLFWIPAFIWVFDRAMRLLRIIIYNPGQWSTTALASYSHSANIIRLSIPVDKALYKPRSGNYFYLTVLDDKRFWESHPFTIASLSGDVPHKAEFTDENEGVPLLASTTDPSEAVDGGVGAELEKQHMAFLIRPYDSFSRRLRDMLGDEQLTPTSVRVLVDGPYGHTQRLHQYQRVLFIAGGSGVVVALSYLNTLCLEAKTLPTVELHWAVREPGFARDVLAKDAREALTAGRLSVHLVEYLSCIGWSLALSITFNTLNNAKIRNYADTAFTMSGHLVFITGASGFIGTYLFGDVLKAGHRVRVGVRSEGKAQLIKELYPPALNRIELIIVSDISQLLMIQGALKGVDYVFHLAGLMVDKGTDLTRDFVDPVVRGTLSILELSAQENSIRKVVIVLSFVSLMPLDGIMRSPFHIKANTGERFVVDLNMDFPGGLPGQLLKYQTGKIVAHQAYRDWVKKANPKFDVVAVHSSQVFGPSLVQKSADELSGVNYLMWATLHSNGPPMTPFLMVDVRDVSRALARIIHAAVSSGTELLLTGPAYTWKQFADFAKTNYPSLNVKFDPEDEPTWTIEMGATDKFLEMEWTAMEDSIKAFLDQQVAFFRA
ncbi:hypothetical protein MKX07_004435 [Trichoderma sp. CBMAI-0711]|nr:hypothetical protein MKX07_004435 [Trichoderma sp. CBMAI-0711]